MKRRLALFLALAMVLSVFLSACTKDTKPENTKTPEPTAPAKPVDKQELKLLLGSEPPRMDSSKATDTVSFDMFGQVMEGLIRNGEGYKPLPGVAEKWDLSADGLTYTFTLRKNAMWSDGKPVTSKDFKYAWLRLADPETAAEYGFFSHYIKGAQAYNELDVKAADYKTKAAELKSKVAIETPDDYTLKVTLAAPTPYFLGLMAFGSFMPQREDIVTKYNTVENGKLVEKYAAEANTMVYNGPFMIESWSHEDKLVMVKNPKYWDAAAVKLEKVNFQIVKDTNTAVQMYETGDADRVGLTGANVDKYKADPGFSTMPDLSTFWLVMNMAKNPAFKNANFKKAISLALDRKAFVESVRKDGSLPGTGAVPPGLASGVAGKDFRSATGNLLPATADKAEALKAWEAAKKELGVNNITIKILIDDGDLSKRQGEAIQAMIQSALPGVKLELDQVTFAIRLDRTKKKDYEMVFAGWGPDYNDPTTFLDLWRQNSAFNDPGWKDPKYDEMLDKAAKELDMAKRLTILSDAEKYLMSQLPIIPVYHRTVARVTRPYVKGWISFAIGYGFDLKGVYVEGKAK